MELLYVVIGVVGLISYFLPAGIAVSRKHPQVLPILLLNVLLGWTVIVWVGCLAWSAANFSS